MSNEAAEAVADDNDPGPEPVGTIVKIEGRVGAFTDPPPAGLPIVDFGCPGGGAIGIPVKVADSTRVHIGDRLAVNATVIESRRGSLQLQPESPDAARPLPPITVSRLGVTFR
jgi:hypothetical protein